MPVAAIDHPAGLLQSCGGELVAAAGAAEIARRAALETLGAAFSRSPTTNGGRVAVAKSVASPRAAAGRPAGGRGAKRAPEDIEAMGQKFAAFVKANPGLRIEQINKELGTTTKDLALPIRKLEADGVITTKGQRRANPVLPGQESEVGRQLAELGQSATCPPPTAPMGGLAVPGARVRWATLHANHGTAERTGSRRAAAHPTTFG